jgi:hypothetical protein
MNDAESKAFHKMNEAHRNGGDTTSLHKEYVGKSNPDQPELPDRLKAVAIRLNEHLAKLAKGVSSVEAVGIDRDVNGRVRDAWPAHGKQAQLPPLTEESAIREELALMSLKIMDFPAADRRRIGDALAALAALLRR